MTNTELTKFIGHYIEHDKTRSAIMLTAPWGAGKSYYIQNELICSLKEHACIVVSLYGLNNLFDVSKAIYLEYRMKFLNKKSETTTVGILAAKTVLKGVTSFFGIDLSKSERDMQKLYKSIDLSGKLIIIEDLERSGIDILEILGYVNNLVEQDGVKVLLVANEDELIQYEPISEETQEKQEAAEILDRLNDHKGRKYTEITKRYLATKEKTISDTIIFEGDYLSAIEHIMSEFSKTYFNLFLADSTINELVSLLKDNKITNLRTFIFACQKVNDIFEYIKPDPKKDLDFIKTILYSIILFSQKIKTGTKKHWEGGRDFSIELSSEKYPLFRFCYDYVLWQTLDANKIGDAKEALEKLRLYDRKKSFGDKDLSILCSWWICSENDVMNAIESITKRLEDESDISFYEYGRIAAHLICAHHTVGCDIKRAKELLIKNLYNKGSEINADFIFTTVPATDAGAVVLEEFKELKKDMIASLMAKDVAIFDFDYQPSSISAFHSNVRDNRGRIHRDGSFMSRLDPEKLTEMLKHCTAENIQDFRGALLTVYEPGNIRDFLEHDKEALEKLLTKIKELLSYDGFDKIQKMQLCFFEDNLYKFIAKL